MRITALRDRGRFRIRLSPTEMGALSKIVALGLLALEDAEGDAVNPLTTGERKALAYWKGKNPFAGRALPKPRRRLKTAKKPSVGQNGGAGIKGRPAAS